MVNHHTICSDANDIPALDSVADDVVVKDGEPSQLDSAVLACANIDLYSHPRSKLRAKSSRVAISGLQSIAETKENGILCSTQEPAKCN